MDARRGPQVSKPLPPAWVPMPLGFDEGRGGKAGIGGVAAATEGGGSFAVELTNSGSLKILVIKVIREVAGIGLKDAKDLADAPPSVVKAGISAAEAEDIVRKLQEAGGVAVVRSR
jgi:large subunit ribosomal protein L7/L12